MSDPQIDERPGGGLSEAFENVHGLANTTSVPRPRPGVEQTQFDHLKSLVSADAWKLSVRLMHECYDLGRASNSEDRYWSGYLDGARDQGRVDYRRGHADGYADAIDQLAALQREAVRSARAAASNPPFAELADRRGDHERAQRQRKILLERGVA